MRTKQVIVMRKDLNMRKGKMVAQGAHASLGAILDWQKWLNCKSPVDQHFAQRLLPAVHHWIQNDFTKICVYVEDEDQLMQVLERADDLGLLTKLIIDNGTTEFNGVKTPTCIAIGPDWIENIDECTKGLPLL